ncbi:MAG TPA: M20 family metallopeptidase [Chthoniobacteraceae bacterium]|nr:M20 family metallopeptidase [Chthoniobacteraceae bacterium]
MKAMQPNNVIELLQALVRIPSVNPHGDAGVAETGEKRCAEFVGGVLESIDAKVELREVQPGRPNVVGVFPTDKPGKDRIVFAPHTDTVSVVGMTIDPFGGELRDGRVWGRGSSDTKGTMAAMLWALRELREKIPSLPYEIQFVGLMSEEAGQDGSKAFSAELRADCDARGVKAFAVVGEPTGFDIVHAHKGALWLTLTTRGRAGHASAPEKYDNAIYKMADLIRCLRDEIAPAFASIKGPLLGSPSVSVGVCHGGSKTNIVPDRCVAQVDIRTIPGEFDALTFVSQKLRAVCPDVEIEPLISPPLYTDPAHPLIRALETAGGKCAGASWFCDAAIFAQAGIPAIAAGPGSIAQAHTADEFLAVADLQAGVEFYKRFIEAAR